MPKCLASRLLVAKPIPLTPLVTNATFQLKLNIKVFSQKEQLEAIFNFIPRKYYPPIQKGSFIYGYLPIIFLSYFFSKTIYA